jgi:hypothetical protein
MTRVWVVVTTVWLGACKLSEITVPVGDPVLVVQAVMRPDRMDQFVVVEWSFSGDVDPGEFEIGDVPAEGSPRTPVEGATVAISNKDFSGDPCGDEVVFTNTPQVPKRFTLRGVYWGPPACPTMRVGDRLALRIETREGLVVTGETTVPGLGGADLAVAGTQVPFGTDDTTTFNRDRDTLHLHVEALAGRRVQLQVRQLADVQRPPSSTVFADTTSFLLPGDALDVFTGRDGKDVFRAGRHYSLTLALSDSNYFDFSRSFSNQFTGRGFINRLQGGIGVFGSLVAISTTVTAVGDKEDEREGVYRMMGEIEGVEIDVELDVYLARPLRNAEFSAFLDGVWLRRCECGPQGAVAWVPRQVHRESLDGRLAGDTLVAVLQDPGALTVRYQLTGVRIPKAPFGVAVADSTALHSRVLGILATTQQ